MCFKTSEKNKTNEENKTNEDNKTNEGNKTHEGNKANEEQETNTEPVLCTKTVWFVSKSNRYNFNHQRLGVHVHEKSNTFYTSI